MIFWAYASTMTAMAENLQEESATNTAATATVRTDIHIDTISHPHTHHAAKTYKLPIIPKPSNLPGPEKEELEGEAKGARGILSNEVMPKMAIGIIGFVGGASLLMLVIGGARFAMVYGTEENVEKAKKQVIYALVGFLIAILSYTIVAIISNLEYKGDTGQGPQTLPTEAEEQAALDAETKAEIKEVDAAMKEAGAEIEITKPL